MAIVDSQTWITRRVVVLNCRANISLRHCHSINMDHSMRYFLPFSVLLIKAAQDLVIPPVVAIEDLLLEGDFECGEFVLSLVQLDVSTRGCEAFFLLATLTMFAQKKQLFS